MKNDEFYLKKEIQARQFESYPLCWNTLFGREAPVSVEIGFGNGQFLCRWAQTEPEMNFVGIELALESSRKLLNLISEKECSNIRVLHENAGFALRELFPDGSLRHVMMNFPDPWPKDRHRRRRLISSDFIRTLSAVLEAGGRYELVTDQEWYAQEAFRLFSDSGFFRLENIQINPERPVLTKYEKKWRRIKRDTFRLLAYRQRSAPVKRLLENVKMPHVWIDNECSRDEVRKIVNREYREENSLFVIKTVYDALDSPGYLIRVMSKDEDYTQMFYVLLVPKEGRWLVKLDPTWQPYRTPAVKMAVWKIGEWLTHTT